ncbi:hypothetical protein BKA93DRAFT_372317 [Sparassis latifolia]|uniref:Uncharacterized protein n=1 Tax=Sparassis crispa TaxID=139825 RepID=A0A401GPI8_9APHY|nr:hypothetical protein SCP_0601150 [Sparassis crispa]GBE84137.1 hypothetical protein SCP_0601150 [Sparassis crispa]
MDPPPKWPPYILEQFKCIHPDTADEYEFYGPYNTLLMDLFPPKEHFQVCPQPAQSLTSSTATNFAFVVKHHGRPVFFLHVKPGVHIKRLTDRVEADLQMRRWFEALVDECKLPVLYSVSALGTRIAFYSCDRETGYIDPLSIERNLDRVTDTAPATHWNVDVQTGAPLMQESLRRIRTMLAEVEREEREAAEENLDEE